MHVLCSNLREVNLERECETAPGKDPRSNAASLATYGHNRPANRQLQKTRKLLPDKLQVEVFLDLQAFGILGQDDSARTLVSQVAPLGFAMRALPAGLEIVLEVLSSGPGT